MGQRKRIGIFYTYNENWIGGTYYILNLISSMKHLEDDQMPEITILYNNKMTLESAKKIDYPYLSFAFFQNNLPLFKRAINYLSIKTIKKCLYPLKIDTIEDNFFDAVFPAPNNFPFSKSKKIIFWIPDFQEIYLPQFFKKSDIRGRKRFYNIIANSGQNVVFSSHDAEEDFKRLFPYHKVNRKVIQFAVTIPEYESLEIVPILLKYNLNKDYFFCSNQFWIHKNHITVLKAIKEIKNTYNKCIQVAFSGSIKDDRRKDYYSNLLKFITDENLTNQVRFLGFIDRREQLKLMKEAQGIIQPSLFEGWSTVVEDSKAMNQTLIVSNLNVHYEQLGSNAIFFNPINSSELADKLFHFKKLNVSFNYNKKHIGKFAKEFMKLIVE